MKPQSHFFFSACETVRGHKRMGIHAYSPEMRSLQSFCGQSQPLRDPVVVFLQLLEEAQLRCWIAENKTKQNIEKDKTVERFGQLLKLFYNCHKSVINRSLIQAVVKLFLTKF